jgi:hypothetical protein
MGRGPSIDIGSSNVCLHMPASHGLGVSGAALGTKQRNPDWFKASPHPQRLRTHYWLCAGASRRPVRARSLEGRVGCIAEARPSFFMGRAASHHGLHARQELSRSAPRRIGGGATGVGPGSMISHCPKGPGRSLYRLRGPTPTGEVHPGILSRCDVGLVQK